MTIKITPRIDTVIKTTEDYAIVVTVNKEEEVLYGVYNTTYGVLETTTSLLPQALEYLDQLQSGVDARMDMEYEAIEAEH